MLRPVIIVVLAVQFSFCPERPRMIRYFNYECAQEEALELAKNSLLDLGYKIDLMAPEGYFMVPKNDLNVFGDDMSIMNLVYYNPDYMIMAEEIIVQEPTPSIFDIY